MPSPFPGMDPYLEDPDLWPDVHGGLLTHLQGALNQRIAPRYVARKEARVYVSGRDDPGRSFIIPDLRVEKKNRPKDVPGGGTAVLTATAPILYPSFLTEELKTVYLTIKSLSGALVAVIELLSPTNKVAGSAGRKSFLEKREEVLASTAHWVEIDLLRAGDRVPPDLAYRPAEYRVLLSRAEDRDRYRCWPISLQDPFPVVGIPLLPPDPDALLDLRQVFTAAYDGGAYDRSVDYRRPPAPPLPRTLAGWANKLLREKGFR